MNEYEFTREEYEIYCMTYLLEPESEVNYNRFREMVENGELIKCINCEEWHDADWMHEYESDFLGCFKTTYFVCYECKNDGFGT